ncbi:MAG: D-galactonate dehydratase family protein [Phycisphaeraceae bacterium]|nr:MAG: D-galactonate dehydratase family protein [Phycisphaeraceae bacterium]
MKITDAKVFVTSPGRNFVTLKIYTEDGVTGLGDCTLNGRERSVKSYLEDHLVPCLIGRDARDIEDIWQYFYRGAYWRRGPVTMAAIGAIDTALWDIKGKALGVPVYQLLGGRSRAGVTVYGHASGLDLAEAMDAVREYKAQGYKAIRVQSGIPGIKSVYGVGRGRWFYEPADRKLPPEHGWSTRKYMNFVPELMHAARETAGPDIELLHDVHHRLTPQEAAELGKRLEPVGLFWLEDPVPGENQEGLRLIRQHTTTPIAIGEVFNSIYDCQTIITEQLCDYIRMTVSHSGGLTHLRKVAALADLYHVRTGCHGPTDISPVAMSACLHFGLWVPNFGIQEFMLHSEEAMEIFGWSYEFRDGMVNPPEKPGLGVEFDEKLAEKYPYQRAYLPVNRREDGGMWNW